MTSRVAIYSRVSVDDRAVSLDAQEAGARQWAERVGHAVTHVYRDDGVSGAEWERRPGVQRLAADARAKPRPFDLVVVRDLDRLGRDAVRLPLLLVDLRDAGVAVVEWTSGRAVELDGNQLFLATVRSHFAAMERAAIAARTRVALEGRARKGLVVGGEVYGYSRERRADGVHYVVNDAEAAVVRDVFAQRARGATIRAIVADLNRRGVASPHAGRRGSGSWSPASVCDLLGRDRYLGLLRWGAKGEEYRHGTVTRVERADVVIVERPDLAVIDRETWERVRALDCPTRANTRHARPAKHLLVGHMLCDACGGRTTVTRTRIGRVSVPAYVCSWRHDRSACESRWLRPVERLDAVVMRWLGDEVVSDDALGEVLEWTRRERARPQAPADDARAASLRAEERELAVAVQRLAAAIEAAPDVAAIVERLRAQEARLRAVRAELSALLAPPPVEVADEGRLARIVAGLRDHLRDDTATARDVLRLVLDGPLRVTWEGPRRGVRLRGSAVPARLLDLAEGAEGERLTRGPSVSPAGVGQSPRLVWLDRAA